MLKIGAFSFRGKCDKHPEYEPRKPDPVQEALCERCAALRDIYEQHAELIRLIKKFGPVRSKKPRRAPIQLSIFETPPEPPARAGNLLEMKSTLAIDQTAFFRD